MLLRMPYSNQLQDIKNLSRRERNLIKSIIPPDDFNEDQRIFPKLVLERTKQACFYKRHLYFSRRIVFLDANEIYIIKQYLRMTQMRIIYRGIAFPKFFLKITKQTSAITNAIYITSSRLSQMDYKRPLYFICKIYIQKRKNKSVDFSVKISTRMR